MADLVAAPFPLTDLQEAYWLGELYRRIDRVFVEWAARDHGAGDEVFPTFLPAAELAKIDYLRSFPHLVTLPLTLSPDPAAIRTFLAEGPQLPDGDWPV